MGGRRERVNLEKCSFLKVAERKREREIPRKTERMEKGV